MTIEKSNTSFGETVTAIALQSYGWLLVVALDGVHDYALNYKTLTKRCSLECEIFSENGIPLVHCNNFSDLLFSDESCFPNMSAVAFINKLPDDFISEPVVYCASNRFISGETNNAVPLTQEALGHWLEEMNVEVLVAWLEFVAVVKP